MSRAKKHPTPAHGTPSTSRQEAEAKPRVSLGYPDKADSRQLQALALSRLPLLRAEFEFWHLVLERISNQPAPLSGISCVPRARPLRQRTSP